MLSPVRSLALKRLSSPGFDGNLHDGDGRIEYHLVLASAGWMPPTLRESLEPLKKMVERLVTRHDLSLPMDLFLVLSFVGKTDLVRQAFVAVVGFDKLTWSQALHQAATKDLDVWVAPSWERPVCPAYVASNNRHGNLVADSGAVRLV